MKNVGRSNTNTKPFARRRSRLFIALAIAGLAICPASQADSIAVTFGAPGQQAPSPTVIANAQVFGTETFDMVPPGDHSFTTHFLSNCKGCGEITGTYSLGANIVSADVDGGAGGSGRYVDALGTRASAPHEYTISLSTTAHTGVNYFGLWISALDKGNDLFLEENGKIVFTFLPSNLIEALGACHMDGLPGGSEPTPYCGDPNKRFSTASSSGGPGDRKEQYAFVNFVDKTGLFNEVVVEQNFAIAGPGPNYESDNHSVGFCANPEACVTGTPVVPEPGTLGLVGTGLIGLVCVARRKLKL